MRFSWHREGYVIRAVQRPHPGCVDDLDITQVHCRRREDVERCSLSADTDPVRRAGGERREEGALSGHRPPHQYDAHGASARRCFSELHRCKDVEKLSSGLVFRDGVERQAVRISQCRAARRDRLCVRRQRVLAFWFGTDELVPGRRTPIVPVRALPLTKGRASD